MAERETMGRDMERYYDYRKKTFKRFEFVVNMEAEKEVYEKLMEVPNKAEYIITLIKNDLKKKH